MGMLLLLALAGAVIAIAASSQKPAGAAGAQPTSLSSDQVLQISAYAQLPASLVPTFTAALRSGDPRVAYATAATLRAQGFARAADLLTQAADSVTKPPSSAPSAPGAGVAPAAPSVAPVPAPSPAAPAVYPPAAPSVPVPVPSAPSSPPFVVPPPGDIDIPPAVINPPAPQVAPAPQVPSVPQIMPLPQAAPQAAPAPAGTIPGLTFPPSATPAPSGQAPAPGSPPGQDPPLPEYVKNLLENILRTAHDPAVIYQAANMLEASGFPRTAAELRKRAVAIANSQVDPVAIIQDILHQADQVKPPATAPTAPAIPPGAMPQYPPTAPAPSVPIPVPVPVPGTTPVSPIPGLSLPNLSNFPIPGLTPLEVPAPAAGTRYYVVESGDNPSKIAKKFTGDANRWREMAKLNPAANLAAGKIYPGQRLQIPPAWPNAAAAGPIVPVSPAPAAPSSPSAAGPSATGGGYDPNLARVLAPLVLADVSANKSKYNREQLKSFQTAAGLSPDGDYGPRAAGAVEYFAGTTAPASLPQYGSGKKSYAPPRNTPPLNPGVVNA